jgi:UDP-glucose 4-epimerase
MNRTVLVSHGVPLRALVTGGAGFIGSHVAEALDALGWYVEVLDNLSSGDPTNVPPGARLRVGDIRSDADVHAAFGAVQFDAVVHCAGQTSVLRSMLDPDLDWGVNVMGTRRLAMAAKASGVRRFVFLSSGGAIYGETPTPADERTMPAPRSYYGLHKYVAEQVLRADGLPYAILRPSNVYGSRQRSDAEGGVVAIFGQRLRAGEPLDVHGDGQQLRDFVSVSDLVGAVLAALAIEDNAIWNVASGEATSITDLAGAMAAVAGRPIEVRYRPRRSGDVERSLLSNAALSATGLWGPPVLLAEGLRLTLTEAPEVVPVVLAALA